MDFFTILFMYVQKFGEEHDIDTINLSDEKQEELYLMLQEAINTNKPISKDKLEEFFGFDPNRPHILI